MSRSTMDIATGTGLGRASMAQAGKPAISSAAAPRVSAAWLRDGRRDGLVRSVLGMLKLLVVFQAGSDVEREQG